jgi:hypothetical protein
VRITELCFDDTALPPFVGALPYGVAVIGNEGALPRALTDPPWLRKATASRPAEDVITRLTSATP